MSIIVSGVTWSLAYALLFFWGCEAQFEGSLKNFSNIDGTLKDETLPKLNDAIITVRDKLDGFIEIFALNNKKTGNFGEHVHKLKGFRKISEGLHSILLTLLQTKITQDFSQKEITFEVTETKEKSLYADLTAGFYGLATQDLMVLSPANPYEWCWEYLNPDARPELPHFIKDYIKAKSMPGGNEEEEKLRTAEINRVLDKIKKAGNQTLIRAWHTTPVPTEKKKRILVLSDREYDDLFAYDHCVELFWNLCSKDTSDTGIQAERTRFVRMTDLQKQFGTYDGASTYVCYDNGIVVRKRRVDENRLQITVLFYSDKTVGNTKEKIDTLWSSTDDTHSKLLDKKKMSEQIDASRRGAIKAVVDKPDRGIRHSYCYHGVGADLWSSISPEREFDDDNLSLEARERKSLTPLLEKLQGQFNLPKDTPADLKKIKEAAPLYRVVHLGVGAGGEIKTLIMGLAQWRIGSLGTYHIVDISCEMLTKARQSIDKIKDDIKKTVSTLLFGKDIAFDLGDRLGENNAANRAKDLHEKIGDRRDDPDSTWTASDKTALPPTIWILVANGFLFSRENALKTLNCAMEKGDLLFVTVERRCAEGETPDADGCYSRDKEIEQSYYASKERKALFNLSLQQLNIDLTDHDSGETWWGREAFGFNKNKPYQFEGNVLLMHEKKPVEGSDNKESFLSLAPDEAQEDADWKEGGVKKCTFFTAFKPRHQKDVEDHLEWCLANLPDGDKGQLKLVKGSWVKDAERNMVGFLIEKVDPAAATATATEVPATVQEN